MDGGLVEAAVGGQGEDMVVLIRITSTLEARSGIEGEVIWIPSQADSAPSRRLAISRSEDTAHSRGGSFGPLTSRYAPSLYPW